MVNWEKESQRYQRRQKTAQSLPSEPAPTKSSRESAATDQENQKENTDFVQSKPYYTSRRQRQRQAAHPKRSTARDADSNAQTKPRFGRALFTTPEMDDQPPKHPLSKSLAALGAGFGALLLGSLLWLSPLTHVSAYQVSGNQNLSKETVLQDSGLQRGMTWLWAMDQSAEVNRRLQKAHLNVQNATLERKGRTITIKVQEYPAVAKIFKKDTLYPVMENQMILPAGSGGNLDQLPLLESFTLQEVKAIAEQLANLPLDVVKQVKRITNIATNDQNAGHIALEMRDGNILVSYINVLSERLVYYPDVKSQLGDKQGLINMEAGIFYTALTPANNPYATKAEKESYQQTQAKETPTSKPRSSSGQEQVLPDTETQRSANSTKMPASGDRSSIITKEDQEGTATEGTSQTQ